jgi:hypothetical protein
LPKKLLSVGNVNSPLRKGCAEGGDCQIGSKEKKRTLMGLDIVAPAAVELSLFLRQPPSGFTTTVVQDRCRIAVAPFAKGEFLQSFGAASVLERPASV